MCLFLFGVSVSFDVDLTLLDTFIDLFKIFIFSDYMDDYKCSTFCLHVLELWNVKEVHLFESNNQGTATVHN